MQARRKRGPPAIGDLTVRSEVQVIERQRPPPDLNDEETEVWAAVVCAEAADWFTPATTPMLAQYCRHVIHAKRVAELISRTLDDLENPPSISEYDKLLKMQERESRAIASLATKMRLSQQSTRTHRGNARTLSQIKVPWQRPEKG